MTVRNNSSQKLIKEWLNVAQASQSIKYDKQTKQFSQKKYFTRHFLPMLTVVSLTACPATDRSFIKFKNQQCVHLPLKT